MTLASYYQFIGNGLWFLTSIYFLPQYIGKGYGKFLLDAVVAELEQLGFDDIFLWVLEDNLRARKFYEKAGFIPSENYLQDNIGGKELREIQYCCSVTKWNRRHGDTDRNSGGF